MKSTARHKKGLQRKFYTMSAERLEQIRVQIAEIGNDFAMFVASNIQETDPKELDDW